MVARLTTHVGHCPQVGHPGLLGFPLREGRNAGQGGWYFST